MRDDSLGVVSMEKLCINEDAAAAQMLRHPPREGKGPCPGLCCLTESTKPSPGTRNIVRPSIRARANTHWRIMARMIAHTANVVWNRFDDEP
jgi:hypothetical protein